ncbi:hypothetical protein [Streptomyces sp. GbtcB6]|uniref:hypothetical protein n=1 Tax=Streptomyces sp. GbtcB6 TaxID=2824751 RepID=UPI001C301F87|nr:hypothetical protein [Streptomyces sp. GbtcB6]
MTELVLRGRRVTARFKRDAVLLERAWRRSRIRIPLAAIETVRTRGRAGQDSRASTTGGFKPRVTEIVLTSASASTDPVVYTLSSLSAEAAQAFVSAVTAALPVRDAAQPRTDGAELVTTEPRLSAETRKDRWQTVAQDRAHLLGLGALFVLGLALASATGDWVLVTFWVAFFTPFLVGCAIALIVCRTTVDWWLLRHRGITVVATFKEKVYGTGTDGETTVTKVYTFTDASGTERTYRGGRGRLVATDPARIEVTYDPYDQDRIAARNGPAVRAFSFLAYALLGLPASALAVAYPLVFFAVMLMNL